MYVCVCSVTSVMSESLRPCGPQPTRLLSPWGSPGKNTGVGCHALLQRIFPTQGLNLHLLCLMHCRWILYHWATWEANVMGFVVVVQSLSHVRLLVTPMDCSILGFPVLHHLPELAQTHVHWIGDAIQPSHLLSCPSPLAFNLSQHQGFL